MREILSFFLISFLFLIFAPQKVFAFEPFVKYANNPLSISATYPGWNELAKYQPTLLLENGVYKLYYASYTGSQFKIAYATSTDGKNFIGQKLMDLYPGFDNHDPTIIKTPDGYTLFFVASTNGGTRNFKIYRIDSADGINFDPNSRRLVVQPINSMESNGTSSPTVLYKNNTYYLFYLCWGNLGFRVCMATSIDGLSWSRCSNNPVLNQLSDGPSILDKSGSYYLFFHGNGGIHQIDSSDELSCNMSWANDHVVITAGPQAYDSNGVFSPSLIDLDSKLYLYYSGVRTVWTVNLAISDSGTVRKPIIFLPGLLGSWNKEAILHNKSVGIFDWKITPIAKEYEGIEKTFNNIGYETDKDIFFFGYDWRKSIDQITNDLRAFYLQKVQLNTGENKVELVGHSLGGLVARIYGQKYALANIDKIITIGSPHQGVAQSYRAVEGGEFDENDKFQWLAQKIILQLYKNKIKSDRQTINEKMPVLKDLFPIYNFLYDHNNNEVNINSMQVKNDTLLAYHSTISDIFTSLQTIIGEKADTVSGFKISERTTLDLLLDLYPDGRPSSSKSEIGDYTVISRSAKADSDFSSLPLDHGEIIYKTDAIKTILDDLQIPYLDTQIIEGSSTKIFPSLIFLILSPATMRVDFSGQIFEENEGIILIENALPGDYQLKVLGNDYGSYQVLVGQIGNESDIWTTIDGQINQNPPSAQQDTYSVSFDPDNLSDFPINQNNILSLFDLLILKIQNINNIVETRPLEQAMRSLVEAKQNYINSDGTELRRNLIASHGEIFHGLNQSSPDVSEELFSAVAELENLFDKSLQAFQPKPSYSFLVNELERYKKFASSLEKSLLRQKARGKDVIQPTNMFVLSQDKLEKADLSIQQLNLDYAEILLKSAKEIIK